MVKPPECLKEFLFLIVPEKNGGWNDTIPMFFFKRQQGIQGNERVDTAGNPVTSGSAGHPKDRSLRGSPFVFSFR
jgi:hypothetical protein